MNEQKLQKLFETARAEAVPAPSSNFGSNVLCEIKADRQVAAQLSVFDLLGALFPRVAIAAGSLIVLCVVGDLLLSDRGGDICIGVAQISEDWLIAANDLPL